MTRMRRLGFGAAARTVAVVALMTLVSNRNYGSVDGPAGQAIGVTNAGSVTDADAHPFVKQFDMQDKINIIPAGGTIPAILAALDQRIIAGGVLSPPTTARAAE